MPSVRHRFRIVRALAALVALVVLLGSGLTTASSGDLQTQISAGHAAADSLRSQIAADSVAISQTAGGLAAAQRRLSALQSQLDAREAALRQTKRQLLAARDRLVVLENRLEASTRALAANLVANYEGGRPDLVSVILDAHGFSDLLERVAFLQRAGHQDAQVLTATRVARREVAQQANALAALERREQALTAQVLTQRNSVAALHEALLRRQIAQLAARSGAASRLHALNARLQGLEARAAAQAAAARRAAAAASGQNGGGASTPVGGIAVDSGGMVHAPAGAPAAVGQVIAAGNAIATLPYAWGGGHGSFHASGYDCSGSVSYALAAAGLLSSPLDSTGFESWGEAGPGRWITVYANAGHAFMVVAGWRFDTVALSEGGTRWTQAMTDTSGFVPRHPPGL